MKHIKLFEEISEYYHKYNIKLMLNAYLETAIWIESDNKDLDDKTIWNFSDESRDQARTEIEWFLDNAGDVFDGVSDTTIAHDLWLTRNGHGAGFFDRNYDEDVLELLEDLAKELGDICLYVGDNEELYFDCNSERYKKFDLEKYKKEKELQRDTKKYNL